MNASPTVPATPIGLVGGLIYGIVEFLMLRVLDADAGKIPMTPETRTHIVAFSARMLAFTGDFARAVKLAPAERRVPRARAMAPRRERTAGSQGGRRDAAARGSAAKRSEGAFGWMQAFVPAAFRDEWTQLMTNAEIVALIAASPAAARHLRWLLRGLCLVAPAGFSRRTNGRTARAPAAKEAATRAAMGIGTADEARGRTVAEAGTRCVDEAGRQQWMTQRASAQARHGAA